MRPFIRRHQGKLTLALLLAAYAFAGSIDYHVEQCSWNGCGEERFVE